MTESFTSLDTYRATSFSTFTGRMEPAENKDTDSESKVKVLRPLTNLNKFSELNYGFSAGTNGNYRNMAFPYGNYEEVMQNRRDFAQEMGVELAHGVFMRPVHGSRITFVGAHQRGSGVLNEDTAIPETDGLVTQERRVILGLFPADCLPKIFFDPRQGVLALDHAGREGTNANIAAQTIRAMSLLGSKPEDIQIGIGPAIDGCCYFLPFYLTTDPENDLKYIALEQNHEGARLNISYMDDGSGRYKISPEGAPFLSLDLIAKNIDQLVAAGVPLENIQNSAICTREQSYAGRMPSHSVTRLEHHITGKYPEGRFAAWAQLN